MLSLAEAPAALPDTTDDIAAHLTAKGIRGVRQDNGCCPIANYLTGCGFSAPIVGGFRVTARGDNRDCAELVPDAIADFIVRFDDGAWPELVLDDTAEATDA